MIDQERLIKLIRSPHFDKMSSKDWDLIVFAMGTFIEENAKLNQIIDDLLEESYWLDDPRTTTN